MCNNFYVFLFGCDTVLSATLLLYNRLSLRAIYFIYYIHMYVCVCVFVYIYIIN